MPEYLVVGQIGRPHGVKGEARMRVFTDFPERLAPSVTVFLGEVYLPVSIRSCRWERDDLLIAFNGYNNRTQVSELRNQFVFVHADDRPPLPDGEYYHHQLLGLRVIAEEGDQHILLGVINEILSSTANDVYVIKTEEGREILFPALESTVLNVDLKRGEMLIHLPAGLLE